MGLASTAQSRRPPKEPEETQKTGTELRNLGKEQHVAFWETFLLQILLVVEGERRRREQKERGEGESRRREQKERGEGESRMREEQEGGGSREEEGG